MKRELKTILLEQAKVKRSAEEEMIERPLNLEMIEALVNNLCKEYSDRIGEDFESIYSYIFDILSAEGQRTIGDFTCLDAKDEYQPWVQKRKTETELFFWNRYKSLLKKDYELKVIQSTDSSTDYILDRLGNPGSPDIFNKRGLVMGSVQMGKTLNYIGLINKAADMGYKLIVVLAGGTETLRQQTQKRIEEGFINKRDGDDDSYDKRKPISYTTHAQDFNRLPITPPSLYQTSNPIVLVCKKNAPVLRNLLEQWLIPAHGLAEDENQNRPFVVKGDKPLLFIDDEADYASVNTADIEDNPQERTTINELIRKILYRFEKKSYLAYTATPFANIFIDPESDVNQWESDDLFPRNFIYILALPSNYKGPQNYFNGYIDQNDHDHESHNNVTVLSDAEDHRMLDFIHIDKDSDDPDDHVYEVRGMTEELKEAIRYFFLVVAERHIRGQSIDHNSMMINFQYLTKLQDALYIHIKDYADELKQSISSYANLPLEHALEDPNLDDLNTTFEEKLESKLKKPRTFQEILNNLNQTQSIEVIQVHYRSNDVLDYDANTQGLNVIAIGGFSLSRGLTLKGLSVSFLDRTTKTSDTLLQMGRWFGYRDGYDDLCHIYIDSQSHDFLVQINETLDELYAELETMHRANLTPKDFGLQVRDHAGGLLITARSKMRSATFASTSISFWGQKYQSVWVPDDENIHNKNKLAVEKFIISLDRGLYEDNSKKHIWRDVLAESILNFLESFQESTRLDNENIHIREFLRELKSEFSKWTVQLFTNQQPSAQAAKIRGKPFESIELGDLKVYSGLRKFKSPENHILKTDRSQIGASDLDQQILTSEEYKVYEELLIENADAKKTQVARAALKNPVLTIFPIIPFKTNSKGDDELIFSNVEGIFLYSITIPRLMKDGSHPVQNDRKYALTSRKIEEITERSKAIAEDEMLMNEIAEETEYVE